MKTLEFTLTPDELHRVLLYGLPEIGMGVLAQSIQMLSLDNLHVYAIFSSDSIRFTYTGRSEA